ncbi:MAG TPA: hypothetical protein VLL08_25285 [Kineosporiaceae bacterium]|nr:hypothetical protein [Kineosporiaceae bacterium]
MTILGAPASTGSPGMRFAVDGWDPSYGASLETEDELGQSTARVVTDVEVPDERWRPISADPRLARPSTILFIDGVRRIEAQIWIDDLAVDGPPTEASPALCASYAAGTICCCTEGAHLLTALPRRGLFTVAAHAVDVQTGAGIYHANHTTAHPEQGLAATLSAALQRSLAELEVQAAVSARAALPDHGIADDTDLLVIDGPLRGRQHLPRALGFIKSHRASYLPTSLHAMVSTLAAGQRTPVFLMGTSWDRHAWYLRLPGPAGAPWAGVVRLECSADLSTTAAISLANLSQAMLPRFASTAYKDSRAPQNLYPIGGLERELRRRLGDPAVLYRALRRAALS